MLVGLAIGVAGPHWVGIGLVVGAVLAYLNGLILSQRVDLAAAVGDVGRALLVMQLGLLMSCTVIGIATIVLIKISLALAVSAAAGFAVAHLAILAAFYWTQGRSRPEAEGKAV
jgi:hypothetical protein